MKIELKACPFCGSDDLLIDHVVSCRTCRAAGPSGPPEMNVYGKNMTEYYAGWWNARASNKPAQALENKGEKEPESENRIRQERLKKAVNKVSRF